MVLFRILLLLLSFAQLFQRIFFYFRFGVSRRLKMVILPKLRLAIGRKFIILVRIFRLDGLFSFYGWSYVWKMLIEVRCNMIN